MLDHAVFTVHLFCTLAMVGVIWFVQVVHYPLFARVERQSFPQFEHAHQQRTTRVVAPLMLLEAATALALFWLRPVGIPLPLVGLGMLLLGLVWASTFCWQVPAHNRLTEGFDASAHRWLVVSNWARTGGWTLRGCVVCLMYISAAS